MEGSSGTLAKFASGCIGATYSISVCFAIPGRFLTDSGSVMTVGVKEMRDKLAIDSLWVLKPRRRH